LFGPAGQRRHDFDLAALHQKILTAMGMLWRFVMFLVRLTVAWLPTSASAETYNCKLDLFNGSGVDRWEVKDGKISVPSHSDLAPSPPWVFPVVQDDANVLIGMQKAKGLFVLTLLIDKRTSKVAMVNLALNGTVTDHFDGTCAHP
jgi:hypothetical protein